MLKNCIFLLGVLILGGNRVCAMIEEPESPPYIQEEADPFSYRDGYSKKFKPETVEAMIKTEDVLLFKREGIQTTKSDYFQELTKAFKLFKEYDIGFWSLFF